MATVLENSTTTSCGRAVQVEEDYSPAAEKESEITKMKLEHKRSISMKESQNRTLQAEVESLQSQLSDRLKQIGIQQEAFQLKDNHIKMLKDMVQDLQNRLAACGNRRRVSYDGSGSTVTRLRQQLKEKQHEIDELKKQISTSSGTKVTTGVDISVGTSDSHCSTEFNGMPEQTDHCHERATSLVHKESTSTQTEAHIDELDRARDTAEKLTHQLQTSHELLEFKENALEERDRTITDLRSQLETQHEVVEQQATLISGLRANMRHQSIELTEVSIQKLQAAISEKDTAMALLELQGGMTNRTQAHSLTQERVQLMKELKIKMQEKIALLQKDQESEEDEDQSILVEELQHCSPDKVCEAIQSLEQSKSRLKGYLDQLLAVVLDSNPNLLEGMPRSQQSACMSPDILRVASLNELLEELKEEEEDMVSLQNYTAMLLQRVVDNSPELLDSIDCQSVHVQAVK